MSAAARVLRAVNVALVLVWCVALYAFAEGARRLLAVVLLATVVLVAAWAWSYAQVTRDRSF